MRHGVTCHRCNGPLARTLDALKRPRLRCPTCDGVAGSAKRRPLSLEDNTPAVNSAFLAESEE